MKIGIASTGSDLNSQVDIRFARAPYFLIVDSETKEFESVKNPYVVGRGVGYATAELLANKGVNAVIAGSVGPNAYNVLTRLGIKMYIGTGTNNNVIENLKNNQLTELTNPTPSPGFGAGRGGFGPGRGAGRGVGGGQGFGHGRGGRF